MTTNQITEAGTSPVLVPKKSSPIIWAKRLLWIMLGFIVLAVVSYLLYDNYNVAKKEDYTLYLQKNDYSLAKFEPEQGAYLGAYVLQNNQIKFKMDTFNDLTQKKHVTFFKYVGYGKPFPQEWVDEVKQMGGFPHIAFEPNSGLDKVKEDAYLLEFAKAAKDSNVPIFLRFASEMNGTWTNYSQDPAKYIEKWKLVHKVMKEHAPNVAMIWAVLSVPEDTIESFYPGDEYVDWVGVNVYSVKYHNNNWYEKSAFEDPLDLLSYVYHRFSATKPILISEFGVTHYNTRDNEEDVPFAIDKITRMYSELPTKFPRVKAIYYFDVNNLTEYNEARRINDYSITNVPEITKTYTKLVQSNHYLTEVAIPQEGQKAAQSFTYRDRIFRYKDELYADRSFFTDFVGAKLQEDGGTATLTVNGKTAKAEFVNRRIWAGYKTMIVLDKFRDVQGLPVKQILESLGYHVEIDDSNKRVTVSMP